MFGRAPRGVSERPKETNKRKDLPSWVWLFVLVLAGLCVMIFLALWQPWRPSMPHDQQRLPTEITQETNEDYQFYELLPQQRVTPIPEQAIPEQKTSKDVVVIQAPKPAPAELKTETEQVPTDSVEGQVDQAIVQKEPRYYLQIRSYDNPDQADARRAEIILNGLSAEVFITNEGDKIWYRVVSGPYATENAAAISQQTLRNSNIDSFIIKQ